MSQFTLLGSRRFGPLFATQFLGALNDNVYKNALVIFIAFTLADRSGIDGNLLVVLAGGIFILPFFLFSATAGQLADKYEKAWLIRWVKVGEIVIMSLGAMAFILQSIALLFVVLFLMGTQSTLFGPLKYGILPQLISLSELTGGNGMVQMGTYISILLGTILGGVLIAVSGYGIFLVTIAVLLLALAGWYSSRFIPTVGAADPGLRVDLNFIVQTGRLLAYARADRIIFIAILGVSWFWFLGATFLSLVPGYTRELLQGNEHVATLLLAAFSVGIGSGSLLCERFSHGGIELGLVVIGALGISVFAFDLFIAGVPGTEPEGLLSAAAFLQHWPHWRVLLDLTGIGLFGGLYIVPLYALIQHRAEPAHRARVIAANNILNALMMVGSALVTMGLLTLGAGIPLIFGLVAVANAVFALLVLGRLQPLRRRVLDWCRGCLQRGD